MARVSSRRELRAFSLVEILAALAVLTLVVVLFNQIFSQTSRISLLGGKSMDTGAEARALFDRMALDFAGMIKRKDVDFYLKSDTMKQAGNDRMAFFSETGGYFPSGALTQSQSPVTLVAYRWNPDRRHIERLGTGLYWGATGNEGREIVYLPLKIGDTWPVVATNDSDPNFETLGPEVFRFEYYYLMKGQTVNGTYYPPIARDWLWDTRLPNPYDVSGLRDVSAIVVTVAVIDPRSRKIVRDPDLDTLSGKLEDFPSALNQPGYDLAAKWQAAVENNGGTIPNQAISGIHIYQRSFNVNNLR